MRIIHDFPPNYDELDAAFGLRALRKQPIFAFGDVIYAPGHETLSFALLAHEAVHGQRQGSDVLGWWRRYIDDPVFRLAEELPAHRAEWLHWCGQPNAARPVMGFRRASDWHLLKIAERLSSPLYGGLVGIAEAKRMISAVPTPSITENSSA